MKPLRVGVIGCGVAAGDLHLPALARLAETEPVAVADPDPAALNRAGDSFGIERRTGDYRELLADPSIDAVCIAAPTDRHVELALAAIDAGKHFLVEKPLSVSVEECDLVIDRAAGSGIRAMVGFNLRWHRQISKARTLIQRGALGDIRLLTSSYASASMVGPMAGWRADPARGGGVLALQAVHHFDFWGYLLGQEIDRVSCSIATVDGSHPEPSIATITGYTERGVAISSAFCGLTGQENGFAVYGSEAWLRASLYAFDGLEVVQREQTLGDVGRHLRRPARFVAEGVRALPNLRRGGDFAASYQAEWRHFADAIRRDAAIETGLEAGREVARILAATVEAARNGAEVRLAETAPRLPPSGVLRTEGDKRAVGAEPGR